MVVEYNSHIRQTFEFVEEKLRFKYVRLGKAYVDLLRVALNEHGLEKEVRSVYDFPLALELGVATVAGQAFIELGLSRVTATLLQNIIPDSNPSQTRAREWLATLATLDLERMGLAKVVIDEITRKGLLNDGELRQQPSGH